MLDKRERLRELEGRMKEHFRREFPESQLWFFEDSSGRVDGYLGTGPVMIVGQRPAAGGWKPGGKPPAPGQAAKVLDWFYGLLVDHGFANAHITDIVKELGKAGTPSWEQVERNWPFFQEELDIIRPRVLVALGGWVHRVLEQKVEYLVPIEPMMHYAYYFIRPADKEKRLREDLARIRGKVDATPGNCCREDDQ